MGSFIDLTGRTFGRLGVLRRRMVLSKHIKWECLCLCGKQVEVRGSHLTGGLIQSCGCLHAEFLKSAKADAMRVNAKTAATTHALTRSPVYRSWQHMIQRCTNPNNDRYHKYGGANPSIKVCPEWLLFEGFLKSIGDRPKGTTLGRTLDMTDYTPSTAFWMTQKEQNLAKRNRFHLLKWTKENV